MEVYGKCMLRSAGSYCRTTDLVRNLSLFDLASESPVLYVKVVLSISRSLDQLFGREMVPYRTSKTMQHESRATVSRASLDIPIDMSPFE